jgi:hypothetical protein
MHSVDLSSVTFVLLSHDSLLEPVSYFNLAFSLDVRNQFVFTRERWDNRNTILNLGVPDGGHIRASRGADFNNLMSSPGF